MDLQAYNILIVDDDKTFAESLKQALTRHGFRAYVVNNPTDALSYIKLQDVHGLIIDCMLPKMNGLELIKAMEEHLSGTPPIVLISGIFKDKQFIKTAIKKTGAIQFFTKPFEITELTEKLSEHFTPETSEKGEYNSLIHLYLSREEKPRKMIRMINNSEGLHNFDLPWVFQILSHAKATGHLNIACTNGDIAGVGFLEGHIVQVNIKNEASLLGILLVEQGYLDRADLNDILDSKTSNKKIGQALVDANLVSPHAINIVLKEQLIWRLKRLVADSQMELNFVNSDVVSPIATITESDQEVFLSDTIENTIHGEWLKTHYLHLSQNLISINPSEAKALNNARLLPFISRVYPSIEAHLNRGTTLEELLANNQQIEVNILKAIHYFNILGIVQIKDVLKSTNLSHKLQRLQKLHNELDKKNYFERLGVSRSAKDSDIKKAYFDLAKVLHPDKLNSSTPEKVISLSEKVFEKIQVAYDTLKKSDRKENYLKELEVGQAEKLLQGDQHLDIGRTFLLKGQYSQAKLELSKAREFNPDSPEIKVLSIWTDIKLSKNITENFCMEIEKKLNQIPLESRDTAAYYHTRGLYCSIIDDKEKARKYFQTALNMDQTFINSRRELSQLGSQREPVNILTADLKDVVGMIFSKKK